MRQGLSHIIFGVILVAAGLAVTFLSEGVVWWWGAVAVGILEIIWGIVVALRSRP
jgi:hypothetical protein